MSTQSWFYQLFPVTSQFKKIISCFVALFCWDSWSQVQSFYTSVMESIHFFYYHLATWVTFKLWHAKTPGFEQSSNNQHSVWQAGCFTSNLSDSSFSLWGISLGRPLRESCMGKHRKTEVTTPAMTYSTTSESCEGLHSAGNGATDIRRNHKLWKQK